jgi:hypothetical protein
MMIDVQENLKNLEFVSRTVLNKLTELSSLALLGAGDRRG